MNPSILPPIDVDARGRVSVQSAEVDQSTVVVRIVARVCLRVRHAHRKVAIVGRDPVGTRIGAEIRVKRAVLLHDHDDVLDLVNRRRDRNGPARANCLRGLALPRLAAVPPTDTHNHCGREGGSDKPSADPQPPCDPNALPSVERRMRRRDREHVTDLLPCDVRSHRVNPSIGRRPQVARLAVGRPRPPQQLELSSAVSYTPTTNRLSLGNKRGNHASGQLVCARE